VARSTRSYTRSYGEGGGEGVSTGGGFAHRRSMTLTTVSEFSVPVMAWRRFATGDREGEEGFETKKKGLAHLCAALTGDGSRWRRDWRFRSLPAVTQPGHKAAPRLGEALGGRA
jgi:hypothetical protein